MDCGLDDQIYVNNVTNHVNKVTNNNKLNYAMKYVEIKASEVIKTVNALFPKASPCPDGIPTLCYKIRGTN